VALTPEEQPTRRCSSLDEKRRTFEQVDKASVGAGRLSNQSRLAAALGLTASSVIEGPISHEQMRKMAQDDLAAAAKLPVRSVGGRVETALSEYERAQTEGSDLKVNVFAIQATIPLVKNF